MHNWAKLTEPVKWKYCPRRAALSTCLPCWRSCCNVSATPWIVMMTCENRLRETVLLCSWEPWVVIAMLSKASSVDVGKHLHPVISSAASPSVDTTSIARTRGMTTNMHLEYTDTFVCISATLLARLLLLQTSVPKLPLQSGRVCSLRASRRLR